MSNDSIRTIALAGKTLTEADTAFAHRRPGDPLDGCYPAEPAYLSLDAGFHPQPLANATFGHRRNASENPRALHLLLNQSYSTRIGIGSFSRGPSGPRVLLARWLDSHARGVAHAVKRFLLRCRVPGHPDFCALHAGQLIPQFTATSHFSSSARTAF